MENTIYRKCVVHSSNSEDGESPTVLYVTQESNGFGVFTTGYDNIYGTLIKWFHSHQKNEAIEFGVNHAEEMMIEQANKKHLAAV